MKKAISMFLATLMLAGLMAACGNSDSGSSTKSSDAGSVASDQEADSQSGGEETSREAGQVTGTINYWYSANEANPNDFGAVWHKKNLELFAEKYPDAKVAATVVTDGEQYLTKITTEMAAGNVPDVFRTWLTGRLEPFVTADRVHPLNDLVENTPALKNVISENAVSLSTFGDNFYALPLIKSGEVIFYNKKLFADNGLTVPETFDELVAVCKTLSEKGITPMALGNKDNWIGTVPYMAVFNRLNGNDLYEQVVIGKEAKFDDPAFAQAGEKLYELVEAGAFGSNFNAIKYDEATTSFAAGKAAMTFDGTWSAPTYIDKLGDDVDFFNFPEIPGGKGSANDWLMNYDEGYAIGKDSQNIPTAEAFLAFMFSEERQKEFAEYGNLIACQNIPVDASKVAPILTKLNETFDNADFMIIPWDNPLGTNIGAELNNITQTVLAGNNAAEAFGKLQKAAQAEWGE